MKIILTIILTSFIIVTLMFLLNIASFNGISTKKYDEKKERNN